MTNQCVSTGCLAVLIHAKHANTIRDVTQGRMRWSSTSLLYAPHFICEHTGSASKLSEKRARPDWLASDEHAAPGLIPDLTGALPLCGIYSHK
jgi:hypothetical protein